MVIGWKTTLRGVRSAQGVMGVASIAMATIASGPSSLVGAPDDPVRFYSTASPPLSYPGPIPETSEATADPFSGTAPIASLASDPPVDPTPAPKAGGEEVVVRANDGPTSTNRPAEPDPMRLASSRPLDRVPGPNVEPPAEESSKSAASAEEDPIASAKALLASCKVRFESIRDYTCTFIKRERIDGRLSSYEVMAMKARTSPQSVYFKFRQPNAGREAIYVHGRNGGKAIVHDVGIGRLVAGSLHLDPRSRRAMDGNRHPITDAGIGFMTDTLLEGWHREMNPLDTVVTIREGVLVNKRPSTMIVCNHPRRAPHFVFHEVRLYIDDEFGLPIRFEAYDFPQRVGETPPLVEEYTYTDLRLNVGLSDYDFDPSNKAYSFGRF